MNTQSSNEKNPEMAGNFSDDVDDQMNTKSNTPDEKTIEIRSANDRIFFGFKWIHFNILFLYDPSDNPLYWNISLTKSKMRNIRNK